MKTRVFYLMASYFCSSNYSRLVMLVSYVCHFFRRSLKLRSRQPCMHVNYMSITLVDLQLDAQNSYLFIYLFIYI
jgi:hypothetical protein